jgi:hypothetical protein
VRKISWTVRVYELVEAERAALFTNFTIEVRFAAAADTTALPADLRDLYSPYRD